MKVIQHLDISESAIVTRWPDTGQAAVDIGSHLVVEESQEAVFFRDGASLDVFGPGRHRLTIRNLPLAARSLGPDHESSTSFQTAVVFVSKRPYLALRWGTREPVVYTDPEVDQVPIRAFGWLVIRIGEVRRFVESVVHSLRLSTTAALEAHLRDVVVACLTDTLAASLPSILDLPRVHGELTVALSSRLSAELGEHGVELVNFCFAGITPSREGRKLIDGQSGSALAEMSAVLKDEAARIESAAAALDDENG